MKVATGSFDQPYDSTIEEEAKKLARLSTWFPGLFPKVYEWGPNYVIMERLRPMSVNLIDEITKIKMKAQSNYETFMRFGIYPWDTGAHNVMVLEDGTYRYIDVNRWEVPELIAK